MEDKSNYEKSVEKIFEVISETIKEKPFGFPNDRGKTKRKA